LLGEQTLRNGIPQLLPPSAMAEKRYRTAIALTVFKGSIFGYSWHRNYSYALLPLILLSV
jgi:hypothetical protein